jgi:hypothetical protein
MSGSARMRTALALLIVALFGVSAWLVRAIDRVREDAPLQEMMYIPSATVVKRLSLGYSGLLADIYWTRAVQYFGGKHHVRSHEYAILSPLLDVTTTLDPQLLPAYQFGSVFLAQKPPEGAGDPPAAARLVEKGIRQNPKAWRLYYDLGYIYWLELKDAGKASEAFARGSQVPGAQPWMKVMAAALAGHAGDTETAVYMWTNIMNSTEDPSLKLNAVNRLRCLRVDDEVRQLEERVKMYQQRFGTAPASWQQLIGAGLLGGIPLDPKGTPYKLVGGRIEIADPDRFPFITQGLPPGAQTLDVPSERARQIELKD